MPTLPLLPSLPGDLVKAGHAIQGICSHERYRQKLVKEFATIKELSGQYGA